MQRLSTGVLGLDVLLGGGLLPGTLTVVVGATGIGKTQLGLQFAHAGMTQEERAGIVFDMNSRGDSQNHVEYAQRMFDWSLKCADFSGLSRNCDVLHADNSCGDYFHVFDYRGRPLTREGTDSDEWRVWQSELVSKLVPTIAFFYGNFSRGVRRAVIDGVEPMENPMDSMQIQLFEYIYQQILRKDYDWVARDLYRQDYRAQSENVKRYAYDQREIGCLLLYTSQETLLDAMIDRPLNEGDVLANANTVIYMGKFRDGRKLGRALYVAKHRGSPCSDEISPYVIETHGLRLL